MGAGDHMQITADSLEPNSYKAVAELRVLVHLTAMQTMINLSF